MTLYMSISWIWSNLNFVMIFFINCCGQFSDIQESGIDKNFFSILIGGRTRVALTPGSGMRIPLALFCSLKGCAGATCIYLIPKLIWTLKASQCAQCWRLSIQNIQDPHPTVCTTIRTESRASTDDIFQSWKPLVHSFVSPRSISRVQMISMRCREPEAVRMQWYIEFWAYPRNAHSKATVLRWFAGWWSSLPFSVTCAQVGSICNAYFLDVCFSCGLRGVRSQSGTKKLTKASNIITDKSNSASQVHSTTDHTHPTPLTAIIIYSYMNRIS